jgi:CheY-like chemotaxis protein
VRAAVFEVSDQFLKEGSRIMAHQEFVLLPDHPMDTHVNPTLLLVESPGAESERYRILAKRAGFRILTASSAPMTRAVSQRSQPDLVVLSPLMGPPGPSELARSIKEDPKTMDIPVMIVVDSDSTDPDMSMVYPTEACASAASSDEEIIKTMQAVRNRRPRERVEPEPTSPLEGDLAEDTFPGVLEFLFTARKTGRIVVLNGSRNPGHIYVEDGDVVHCELVPHHGIDAFNRMCFLTHGRFKFEPEFRSGQRTMNESGMEILLESARRRDELSRERNGPRG